MSLVQPTENPFARHATAIAIGVITAVFLLAALMFVSQNATLDRARGLVDHSYAAGCMDYGVITVTYEHWSL